MSEDPTPYKTKQNFVVDIRIDKIGFRALSSNEGSFVKYAHNQYFGRLEQYLESGWEDKGDYIQSQEKFFGTISKSLFNLEETNYTIGFLKYDEKEDNFQLTSVGDRILIVMVDKKDRDDFYEVYMLAEKKMMELTHKEKEIEKYV